MPTPAAQQHSDLFILVVDDDTFVRTAVKRALVRAGHRVSTAANAEQALALLRSLAFDVAIVDWYMPGSGGRGFVFAAADVAPGLPIVLMSGSVGMLSGLTGGFGHLAVLPKPWSDAQLRGVVQHAAGSRRPYGAVGIGQAMRLVAAGCG